MSDKADYRDASRIEHMHASIKPIFEALPQPVDMPPNLSDFD